MKYFVNDNTPMHPLACFRCFVFPPWGVTLNIYCFVLNAQALKALKKIHQKDLKWYDYFIYKINKRLANKNYKMKHKVKFGNERCCLFLLSQHLPS